MRDGHRIIHTEHPERVYVPGPDFRVVIDTDSMVQKIQFEDVSWSVPFLLSAEMTVEQVLKIFHGSRSGKRAKIKREKILEAPERMTMSFTERPFLRNMADKVLKFANGGGKSLLASAADVIVPSLRPKGTAQSIPPNFREENSKSCSYVSRKFKIWCTIEIFSGLVG